MAAESHGTKFVSRIASPVSFLGKDFKALTKFKIFYGRALAH